MGIWDFILVYKMKIIKIIKFVLFGIAVYFLFPSFNNGLIIFVLKFLFYLLILYFIYALVNDIINYIVNNWQQAHLKYIDEREHIKGHTLANLTRLDFLGALFRLFHYIKYNRKKIMYIFWISFLDKIAITLTFILGFIIIVGFIIIRLYIIS